MTDQQQSGGSQHNLQLAGIGEQPLAGRMIRVLLADDNEAVRLGLLTLLAEEPDISVIGAAADGRAAVTMALADPPDVMVMDLSMPVLDGVAAIREISRDAPSVKILVCTAAYPRESVVREAFAAGAHGYISKGWPATRLLEAIRAVYRGEFPVEAHLGPLRQPAA
jgi:DNA-binding NarL/FixJ family response regulator